MSYVERQIDLTITLQQAQNAPAGSSSPTFQGTNSNTVKISGGGPAAKNGLHISAQIVRAGGNSLGNAEIQVYNLPLSIMNQLSTLGTPLLYQVGKNTVLVEAGDASGMSAVFSGTIVAAWAEFTPEGDAIFNISAFVGALNATAPAQSTTYPNGVSVATAMANFATLSGYNFENDGVTTQLPPSYFSGSVLAQIQACAAAAGIEFIIDDASNTLAIWPKGGSRGGAVPLISAETGMVGYPRFTANGVEVEVLFTPSIGYGQKIQIKGIITPANQTWVVFYLDYDLECQAPDGPWFMRLQAAPPGFVAVSSPGTFRQ